MERFICVFLLIFAVALVWTSDLPAQTWEFGYEGNEIPDDPVLGDDFWGVCCDGVDSSDVCTITATKELFIDDPANKVCFFLRELENGSVGTIEARVKVLAQSGADYTILMGIENDDAAWLCLFPDHIMIHNGQSFYVDMTEYHILRLARENTNIVVYVDGEAVLEGQATASGEGRTGMIFGAGSTSGTGEHYWDYVTYTTAGAFAPDELVDYLTSMAVQSEGKLATYWGAIKSR